MLHNVGVVVEGVLSSGARADGKIAIVVTDYLQMERVVEAWECVTGKHGTYVELSDQTFEDVWGKAGAEIAAQMRWSEQFPTWEEIFLKGLSALRSWVSKERFATFSRHYKISKIL